MNQTKGDIDPGDTGEKVPRAFVPGKKLWNCHCRKLVVDTLMTKFQICCY